MHDHNDGPACDSPPTASRPDAVTQVIRRASLTGIVGSALTLVTGVAVQTIVQPSTEVSDDLWSYPWTSGALVPVSVFYALLHVLVIIGTLGLGRSPVIGESRRANAGIAVAGRYSRDRRDRGRPGARRLDRVGGFSSISTGLAAKVLTR